MRNSLIFTMFAMMAVSTPPLLSCPCRMTPSPCEAVNEADAVFLGTAVREVETNGYRLSVLRVDEAYAGITELEVMFGGALVLGKQYLIYGRRSGDKLYAAFCDRDGDEATTEEHLEFLRAYRAGETKTEASGVVYHRDLGRAMKGVRMVLSSAADKYEAETDGEGRFLMSGLAPGEYELKGVLEGFDSFTHPVRVKRGACAVNFVQMEVDRRLYGTVRTASGEAAPGVLVQLVQVNPERGLRAFYSDQTDANGNYAIRMLEPGEYELGINIDGTPSPSSPHVPTYWPGKKVFVPEGAVELRHDWIEPERIRLVTVRGRVLRRDGTPSVERVALIVGSVDKEIVADAEGWFQFEYCEGQPFHIAVIQGRTEVEEGVAGDGKALVLVLER